MNVLDSKMEQKVCNFFNLPKLKEHQKKVLEKVIIDKTDALVVLKTGMGKSLCFEALHVAKAALDESKQMRGIVLKFLMEMQCDWLNKHGLKTSCLGSDTSIVDIQEGKLVKNPKSLRNDMYCEESVEATDLRDKINVVHLFFHGSKSINHMAVAMVTHPLSPSLQP